jgi:hypothetical protein
MLRIACSYTIIPPKILHLFGTKLRTGRKFETVNRVDWAAVWEDTLDETRRSDSVCQSELRRTEMCNKTDIPSATRFGIS